MYDAIVSWQKTQRGKVYTAHYVTEKPTKKEARAEALELFALDEGKMLNVKVMIVKSKRQA